MSMTTTTNYGTWNGPICQTCSKGYLGVHACDPADLLRIAARLIEMAARNIKHA